MLIPQLVHVSVPQLGSAQSHTPLKQVAGQLTVLEGNVQIAVEVQYASQSPIFVPQAVGAPSQHVTADVELLHTAVPFAMPSHPLAIAHPLYPLHAEWQMLS